MFKKKRYTGQEKYEILSFYISGLFSIKEISEEYQINRKTLNEWKFQFDTWGFEGLELKKNRTTYSREVKLNAIRDYLESGLSLREVCAKYSIFSKSSLIDWIKKYNRHVDLNSTTGRINHMTKNNTISLNEKIEAIHFCIEKDYNYIETVNQYKISYQQIYSWVQKYEKNGPDGLIDRRGQHKPIEKLTDADRTRFHIKELEARNLRLEAENAYLKKLKELKRRGF